MCESFHVAAPNSPSRWFPMRCIRLSDRLDAISNTDVTRHDVSRGSTSQGYDLQDDGKRPNGQKKNLLIGVSLVKSARNARMAKTTLAIGHLETC